MVDRKWIALAVIAVMAIITVIVMRSNADLRQVTKHFARAEKAISKEGAESNFVTLAKTQDFSALLAPECTLNIPGTALSGTYSSRDAGYTAASIRSLFSTLSLTFADMIIEFSDKDTAQVTASGTVRGTVSSGETFSETRELRCTLKRIDGKFLFTECTALEILQR